MARHRRHRPYDPAKVHDRRTTDLLRNAQVSPIEIDDPLEIGGKLMVMRSIRNDPLAGLHARSHIDEAQYQGGRAFQHDFETAERGPRAIDPSKEAVDGGKFPEPLTDQQRDAVVRLNRAERVLGQNGSALAHGVLIHGMTIEQIGVMRGTRSELELKYLGRRFRECLDCLALVYGFAMESNHAGR
jgi:hypothetical protein